jgi:hypothetical protein
MTPWEIHPCLEPPPPIPGNNKAYSSSSSRTALQGPWLLPLAWKRSALHETCELWQWHLPRGSSRAIMCGTICSPNLASHEAFLETIHLHTCIPCVEAGESEAREAMVSTHGTRVVPCYEHGTLSDYNHGPFLWSRAITPGGRDAMYTNTWPHHSKKTSIQLWNKTLNLSFLPYHFKLGRYLLAMVLS